jgi:cysteine sulfinate desulfinase/cysteine desulfurase-like protein
MGLDSVEARSSLRFSFGRFNTPSEVERAIEVVTGVVGKLRRENPLQADPVIRAA